MEITHDLIHSVAQSESIRRGRSYFRAGRVVLVKVTPSNVVALVRGSRTYHVELTEDVDGVIASCTCPFNWYGECKHIVAVMFAVIETAQPAMLRKSPQTPWLKNIHSILPAEEAPAGQLSTGQPWRIAYGLSISGTERRWIPIRISTRKTGEDGRSVFMRDYDLDDEQHFDLNDRLIFSIIATGFSINVRSQALERRVVPLTNSPMAYYRDTPHNRMGDLIRLLKGKELYLTDYPIMTGRRIYIHDEPAELRMEVSREGDHFTLAPDLQWKGTRIPLTSGLIIVCEKPLWLLWSENIFPIHGVSGQQLIALQALKGPLQIPEAEREQFIREGLPAIASHYTIKTELELIQPIDCEPVPCVYLREFNKRLFMELRFRYDSVEVWDFPMGQVSAFPTAPRARFVDGGDRLFQVVRRHDVEARLFETFQRASVIAVPRGDAVLEEFEKRGQSVFRPTIPPLDWMLSELPKLREAGFLLYGEEQLKSFRLARHPVKMAAAVRSGIDWFDLSLDISFGGSEASFQSFLESIKKNDRFVRLDDGTMGVLPEEWMGKFRRAFALSSSGQAEGDAGTWRLGRPQIGLIDELLSDVQTVQTDDEYARTREKLRAFKTIAPKPVPSKFHGKLRRYQKAGYDWLHFLREFRFGGILADDMGLGKTIQTLAFLQRLYADGATLPTLIVAPTSVVFNWESEAQKFTPSLSLYRHTGPGRGREKATFTDRQLIVTSYGILRRDIQILKDVQFLCVILDESQNIKNPASVNAKAVRCLKAEQRLALTGTPVENGLMDLWSQMAFLNPGMMGSPEAFSTHYARPIEREQDEAIATSLKKLVFPFILRRTKELVADDLPPKQESVVYCEMEKSQRVAYEHWREYYRRSVLKSIDEVGIQRSKIKVLEGLMRLRQVCCHPKLVDAKYAGSSGKYESFMTMIEEILLERHKVLVFSQFVKMLTILREELNERGIQYEYLDGSTIDRQERVRRFQSDDGPGAFLISLKAGGTGLNLTAADYVIHYDPWWNPAVEMQATDRTHRIGQTKHVFSYKLITRDSVEEKVLLLQEKKKNIVSSVITTDSGFMKTLTRGDIESLLS